MGGGLGVLHDLQREDLAGLLHAGRLHGPEEAVERAQRLLELGAVDHGPPTPLPAEHPGPVEVADRLAHGVPAHAVGLGELEIGREAPVVELAGREAAAQVGFELRPQRERALAIQWLHGHGDPRRPDGRSPTLPTCPPALGTAAEEALKEQAGLSGGLLVAVTPGEVHVLNGAGSAPDKAVLCFDRGPMEVDIAKPGFSRIIEPDRPRQRGLGAAAGSDSPVERQVLLARIDKTVTISVLRHSAAVHWLELGVDLRTLQQVLGHGRLSTTMRYMWSSKTGLQFLPQSPLPQVPGPPPRAMVHRSRTRPDCLGVRIEAYTFDHILTRSGVMA